MESGGRCGVTLRDRVVRGTAGKEVLDPAPYIRGCVRANHPISTSQEFLTTTCWLVVHLVVAFGAIGCFVSLQVVKTLQPHPLDVG